MPENTFTANHSSEKQRSYIAFQIHKKQDEYNWMKTLMDSIPYEELDNRQIKLAEIIRNITNKEADYFIKAHSGERGYDLIKARNILMKYIKPEIPVKPEIPGSLKDDLINLNNYF